jgi:predicted helicase
MEVRAWHLYNEMAKSPKSDLFAKPIQEGMGRRDAITDAGLAHFQKAYSSAQISKEDLFYYVYGILHSPDYRDRYADNLSKELPRIPAVKKDIDFWAFSEAGRALAHLHLNYEIAEPYPLVIESKGALTNADYRVEKMRFAKKGEKTHRFTITASLSKASRRRLGSMWSMVRPHWTG